LPQFTQYTAKALLLEPQKMQNLEPSELAISACEMIGPGAAGTSVGSRFVFLVDQTAREIEIIIANAMRMKKRGLSTIKLKDSGRTG
jgi:hypothetical protein